MQEYIVVQYCGVVRIPEWHEDVYVLARFTTAQGSRVDLIVSAFQIMTILNQDGEGNLPPLCVLPVGSHQKGDEAETFCFCWLD